MIDPFTGAPMLNQIAACERDLRCDRRDRFAAAALAGLLANPTVISDKLEEYATTAVKHADALLAALDRQRKVPSDIAA